ncbi:MAG: 3-hydroxyacyl-CoA dehydrogenase NAD-binding domain-containing protein [Acidobacteriota bacterium]
MDQARLNRPLAVLGAGIMGHGIAHAALAAGYTTRLYDVSTMQAEQASDLIAGIIAQSVALGKVTPSQAAALQARLTTTTSLPEAVAGAGVIVEAAPERMDLKLALLADVQASAPADAVIVSNTSALSLTDLAVVLDCPGRIGGMHFFNPVHKMKLVEIVRALETSDDTVEVMTAVAAAMGKETVLIRESPGFITSRINALIGNEAFYMLQEGVASARDIDKALKLGLNHPMGPFALVDLVGLDTRLSILRYLHRTLGEKFRPCPLLEQHVAAGRLGRKTGRGVYDYEPPA